MLAGGAVNTALVHERSHAGERGEHIVPSGHALEIAAGVVQDEADFLFGRLRVFLGSRSRNVGGANQRMTVPRNHKQHPPIVGVRHHDGRIAWLEGTVEHHMHPLRRLDHRLCVG